MGKAKWCPWCSTAPQAHPRQTDKLQAGQGAIHTVKLRGKNKGQPCCEEPDIRICRSHDDDAFCLNCGHWWGTPEW